MEDADGIAQWNASGSRKKLIVTAGSRAEQLEGRERSERAGERVNSRTGMGKRQTVGLRAGMPRSLAFLVVDFPMIYRGEETADEEKLALK
jgi:hypothetical protein